MSDGIALRRWNSQGTRNGFPSALLAECGHVWGGCSGIGPYSLRWQKRGRTTKTCCQNNNSRGDAQSFLDRNGPTFILRLTQLIHTRKQVGLCDSGARSTLHLWCGKVPVLPFDPRSLREGIHPTPVLTETQGWTLAQEWL